MKFVAIEREDHDHDLDEMTFSRENSLENLEKQQKEDQYNEHYTKLTWCKVDYGEKEKKNNYHSLFCRLMLLNPRLLQ